MNNEFVGENEFIERIEYINGFKVIIISPIRTEEEEQAYRDRVMTNLYYKVNQLES